MSLAIGAQSYDCGNDEINAIGVTIAQAELEAALNGAVGAIVRDDSGTDLLDDLVLSIADTAFDPQALRDIIAETAPPDDWRVGEAIAEAYLVSHRQCTFPWPFGRDLRDPHSNMAGTDLVGFQNTPQTDPPCRFAFSEAKTSSQVTCPPSVMYGRHGLKKQIEELRDRSDLQRVLIKYLAFRAPRSDWEGQYRHAVRRYITDSGDFAVFGIMIRDVPPNVDDLRARSLALKQAKPPKMAIELLAIYLPAGAIASLSQRFGSN